ncbi:hypothetical protein ACFE04_010587 [Oxalis oulophora]
MFSGKNLGYIANVNASRLLELMTGAHANSRSTLEVPIFWFIHGDLLLVDKHLQAKALSDMVIVIQSDQSFLESPLQCNGKSLLLDLRRPIKPAMAAISEHLAGLLPLPISYSQAHESAIEDWTWSVGCNPLSMTSQGWHISQFQTDTIARSYIITALEESVQSVNSAIHLLLTGRTIWVHVNTSPFRVAFVGKCNMKLMLSTYMHVISCALYYVAVTTITTIGYGDIHPVNHRERLFHLIYAISFWVSIGYVLQRSYSLFSHDGHRSKKKAIKTEIRYFNLGEYLIIRNESPNFLFLLLQGQVELMDVKAASNEQENNVRLNACCGALGVLFNENQPYIIRARSNSMVLRLGANDFGDSIRHTTRDYVILYHNIFRNLNTYTSGDLYNYVTQKENSIVDGTLPLQFKLIIAARVGNFDLMMKLVDAGENHLESSEHNQTLLHHAIASGNKECLVYAHQLVKEHMDINTRDTTGSIPIWEALLHGHYDLAQHMSERMSANLNAGTVHQFLVKVVELNSPIRVRKMIDLGMDVNLIREGEGGHHVVRIASQRNCEIYNMLERFLNGGPLAAVANNQGEEEQPVQGEDEHEHAIQDEDLNTL